jgi:hypothetical protein
MRAGAGGKNSATTRSSQGKRYVRNWLVSARYDSLAAYASSLKRRSSASDARAATSSERALSKTRYA